MSDVYLSENEIAELYGISERTLARWRTTGDGPPFVRMGRRRVAYRLSDSEAWAAGNTFASRADEMAREMPRPACSEAA